MTQTRSRNYCFTYHNPTEGGVISVQAIDCKYIIYGHEICPRTQRPHLQGYVHFQNQRWFNSVKRLFPDGTHIEACSGSIEDNITYCSKGGNTWSKGTPPESGKRTDLDSIVQRLIETKKIQTIIEEKPTAFVKYHKGMRDLEFELKKGEVGKWNPDRKVHWYYGPPGSGKSRKAFEFEDIWCYAGGSEFFDGYSGQKTAIFDDLRPKDLKISTLLRILDKRVIPINVKGSVTIWNPSDIIITSPFSLTHFFSDSCAEDIRQLQRRVDITLKFPIIEGEIIPLVSAPSISFCLPERPENPFFDFTFQNAQEDLDDSLDSFIFAKRTKLE